MNASCIGACDSDVFISFLEFLQFNNILDNIVRGKYVLRAVYCSKNYFLFEG